MHAHPYRTHPPANWRGPRGTWHRGRVGLVQSRSGNRWSAGSRPGPQPSPYGFGCGDCGRRWLLRRRRGGRCPPGDRRGALRGSAERGRDGIRVQRRRAGGDLCFAFNGAGPDSPGLLRRVHHASGHHAFGVGVHRPQHGGHHPGFRGQPSEHHHAGKPSAVAVHDLGRGDHGGKGCQALRPQPGPQAAVHGAGIRGAGGPGERSLLRDPGRRAGVPAILGSPERSENRGCHPRAGHHGAH